MNLKELLSLAIVFIVFLLLFRYSSAWIKKLKPKTVKTINWFGFAAAIAGGILWYAYKDPRFMVVTFLGIVIYFLFYHYEEKEG